MHSSESTDDKYPMMPRYITSQQLCSPAQFYEQVGPNLADCIIAQSTFVAEILIHLTASG